MRISYLVILLSLLISISGCKKEDQADAMELLIDLPIANTGDVVEFRIKNPVKNYTGFRYDPGDGSGAFSGSFPVASHIYTNPGSYTITATVFYDNESTQLTASITVEGTPTDTTTNNTAKGIRVTKVELVQLEYPYEDNDVYQSNGDNRALSDPYFTVSYYSYDAGTNIIYPRSSTKYDLDVKTWNLGTSVPIIYYENIDYMEITFYDDDAQENSSDDYAGSITVYVQGIEAYEASKPTSVQLTGFGGTSINVDLEWIN